MIFIARRIAFNFAKWSKPLPKKSRQVLQRSFASGDQKAAKLSKSEQEQQNKLKMVEAQKIAKQTTKNIAIMRTHTAKLQEYKSTRELQNIRYHQELYLLGSTKKRQISKADIVEGKQVQNFQYLPIEPSIVNPQTSKFNKFEPIYGNYTAQMNKRFPPLKEFEGNQKLRRMGTLGVKLGMTTLWDRWGSIVPATIIQLDRVQIVQIKKPLPGNTFYQVQLGIGAKRIKKVSKPLMGHYLKARVPPKQRLAEFRVSEQCLLPIGYTISARHYTPGMFVDISGKTVGHGFQGTIKRHSFSRQPATHGNSLTTRVLGSTGQRQDPGRVFKQKKMYGHMGQKISVQKGMTIFKIDTDKNIIYIKGTVPGKAGTILKISDTLCYNKCEKNLELSHFPTFVEQPGVKYARQFSMYCGQRDPNEIQIHDNAFILDDLQDTQKDEIPAKDAELQE